MERTTFQTKTCEREREKEKKKGRQSSSYLTKTSRTHVGVKSARIFLAPLDTRTIESGEIEFGSNTERRLAPALQYNECIGARAGARPQTRGPASHVAVDSCASVNS